MGRGLINGLSDSMYQMPMGALIQTFPNNFTQTGLVKVQIRLLLVELCDEFFSLFYCHSVPVHDRLFHKILDSTIYLSCVCPILYQLAYHVNDTVTLNQ